MNRRLGGGDHLARVEAKATIKEGGSLERKIKVVERLREISAEVEALIADCLPDLTYPLSANETQGAEKVNLPIKDHGGKAERRRADFQIKGDIIEIVIAQCVGERVIPMRSIAVKVKELQTLNGLIRDFSEYSIKSKVPGRELVVSTSQAEVRVQDIITSPQGAISIETKYGQLNSDGSFSLETGQEIILSNPIASESDSSTQKKFRYGNKFSTKIGTWDVYGSSDGSVTVTSPVDKKIMGCTMLQKINLSSFIKEIRVELGL